MTARLLRAVLATFPAQHRATRGPEIADALAATDPRGWTAVQEAGGLLAASSIAWRSYLSTNQAVKNSVALGFLTWFGFLVGIGPVSRVVWAAQDKLPQNGGWGPNYLFVVAAGLLIVALASWAWNARIALVLLVVATVVTGWSTINGGWDLLRGSLYETRWLAVPFALSLWFRPTTRTWWHATMAFAAMSAGALIQLAGAANPAGYSGALRSIREEAFASLFSLDAYQWEQASTIAAIAILLAVATLPWFLPAAAAVMLGPLTTAALVTPFPVTIAALLYVIIVVWARQARSLRIPDALT